MNKTKPSRKYIRFFEYIYVNLGFIYRWDNYLHNIHIFYDQNARIIGINFPYQSTITIYYNLTLEEFKKI